MWKLRPKLRVTPAAKQIRIGAIRRVFRHFAPHLRPYRRKLLLSGVYLLGATVMELLRPWPLKLIFDWVLVPSDKERQVVSAIPLIGDDPRLLLSAIVLSMLIIAVFVGLFRFREEFLTASVGQKVVARVRYDLYCHLQRLSHSFHDNSSLGDLLARLTGDIRRMRDLMVTSVIYLADRSLVITGMIIVMLLMDWRLTLVALIIVPLLALTITRFTREIKVASRRQRRKESKITNVLTEKLSSIKVVQAFAREAYEEERFAQGNKSSTKASLRTKKLEGQLNRTVQIVLAAGTGAVAWFGVSRVQVGALSPGDLLVFTAYLAALYKPIRRLASLTSRIAKATVSGERIVSILEIEPEVKDAPDAIEAPRFRGDIVFDAVHFAHTPDLPVLCGVSFSIPAGKTVALVGESGSGKSTLADLLLRFYDPSSGAIRVDGTDIRRLTQDSLRRQIGVVLQDSVLFDVSIRDNIAYGDLDASESRIIAAARDADIHDFVSTLPDGYETLVGERGANLSGGQRQRIAIARALVKNAPILILDEPMSHLDAKTEAKIELAMERLMAGRTCLYVTHDLRAAAYADVVLALRDGRLHQESEWRGLTEERLASLYSGAAPDTTIVHGKG
ncbi:MAG: ABC transporter ATP-binding protein/permease [Acidobacteriota bacterium]|nr:ABC transporter ATP-binding protein/permease [Acidobacteriota bacterium]